MKNDLQRVREALRNAMAHTEQELRKENTYYQERFEDTVGFNARKLICVWEAFLDDIPTGGTTSNYIEDDTTEESDFLGYERCSYSK